MPRQTRPGRPSIPREGFHGVVGMQTITSRPSSPGDVKHHQEGFHDVVGMQTITSRPSSPLSIPAPLLTRHV
jgi:hypothetical protein